MDITLKYKNDSIKKPILKVKTMTSRRHRKLIKNLMSKEKWLSEKGGEKNRSFMYVILTIKKDAENTVIGFTRI